jgi:hypothetical protein
MWNSRDKRIADVLDQEEPENDLSLRGQALRRAQQLTPPKTLTAWEWEAWYAEHGVPKSHRQPRRGRWRGFFRRWFPGRRRQPAASRNCLRSLDEDAEF